MKDLKKEPARIMKAMRNRAGMTQEALGRALGVHQSVIARWESGKHEPSMSTIIRIAEITHSPIDI